MENYFGAHRKQAGSRGEISGRRSFAHWLLINAQRVTDRSRCRTVQCLHSPQVWPWGPEPGAQGCPPAGFALDFGGAG